MLTLFHDHYKHSIPQNPLSPWFIVSLEGVEGEHIVQASAEGIHLALLGSQERSPGVEPHLVRTGSLKEIGKYRWGRFTPVPEVRNSGHAWRLLSNQVTLGVNGFFWSEGATIHHHLGNPCKSITVDIFRHMICRTLIWLRHAEAQLSPVVPI